MYTAITFVIVYVFYIFVIIRISVSVFMEETVFYGFVRKEVTCSGGNNT